jgi:predicted short-subunit dehydrogenase-like oxidoreductase (DUF2520 family)
MDIVIIGSGNTAAILGRKLKAAGHNIVQIFGRNTMAASELAYELDTESTNYWNVVTQSAELYIIAVSDIAIEEVLKELQLKNKIVVHTAAAVSKDILKSASSNYGVFYPLQTLKRDSKHLPDTPIIIDASNEDTFYKLLRLAEGISTKVVPGNDELRLKLHLAAVFCNNFSNHLYRLMEDYCRKENIDFTLLIPLIAETGLRIIEMSPSKAQTGPAVRNDHTTLKQHKALLQNHPQLKSLYELFTESIRQYSV